MLTHLPHKLLMTLNLDVNSAATVTIGSTAEGDRKIAPISGGEFEGERLSGHVIPGGADWVRLRADGTLMIDVRVTLATDDGATIYLSYQGRFIGATDAMARLAKGEELDSDSYSLVTTAKFECGDPRYQWLNDVIAVAIGSQSGFNPTYSIFEIG